MKDSDTKRDESRATERPWSISLGADGRIVVRGSMQALFCDVMAMQAEHAALLICRSALAEIATDPHQMYAYPDGPPRDMSYATDVADGHRCAANTARAALAASQPKAEG